MTTAEIWITFPNGLCFVYGVYKASFIHIYGVKSVPVGPYSSPTVKGSLHIWRDAVSLS